MAFDKIKKIINLYKEWKDTMVSIGVEVIDTRDLETFLSFDKTLKELEKKWILSNYGVLI